MFEGDTRLRRKTSGCVGLGVDLRIEACEEAVVDDFEQGGEGPVFLMEAKEGEKGTRQGFGFETWLGFEGGGDSVVVEDLGDHACGQFVGTRDKQDVLGLCLVCD